MNKEKFIDCLRDPSLLQDNDIQELNQMVKRYPYFQGARALLAKVSKERNLKDAAHRISSAAVYTTDRALLKKYISDHLFFLDSREALKEEEKAAPAKAPAAKTPRPPAQSKEAAKQATPRPSAPKPASSGDKRPKPTPPVNEQKESTPWVKDQNRPVKPKAPSVSREEPVRKPAVGKKAPPKPAPQVEEELTDLQQSSTNLDDWIKEIHEDIEALKKSKARFQELDRKLEEEEKKKEAEKEEEDAVNAALKKVTSSKKSTPKKASKEIEESDKNKEPDVKVTKGKTATKTSKKEVPTKKDGQEDLVDKAKEEKSQKPKTRTPKKKTSTKKAPGKSEPVVNEAPVKAEAEEKEPEVKKKPVKKVEPQPEEDTSTLKVVRRRSGKVKSTTFESVDKEKTEEESKEKIIDEFISTSPKISKADKSKLASEEDKEDLSDKSSRFQADIGTEYLAEIYVEQGKIDRAISIYEKLSLKFPEKKSYFVARIEELKSK